MATAKKKPAAKKAASKKSAAKPALKKKAASAPVAKQATKVPKKKPAKKAAAAKTPGLGKTVNLGPTRGDSSWPPSNKPMSQDRSRTDRTSTTANRGGGRKAGEAPKKK